MKFARPLLVALTPVLIMGPINASAGISTNGAYSLTTGSTDFTGGTGAGIAPTLNTLPGEASFSIFGTSSPADAWRIDVSRTEINWPAPLTLAMRHSGDGTGSGSISGGSTFQIIVASETTIFTGSGDLANIPIQLQLGGISLKIPPGNYSTTLTYTITDS